MYAWLKSYLHSDGFRVLMGDTVGKVIKAKAEFALFNWQGMEVSSDRFFAEEGRHIDLLAAEGVSANLSLSGVKRGIWEISDVRVKSLNAVIDHRSEGSPAGSVIYKEKKGGTQKDKKGVLQNLLPKKTELLSAQVDQTNISFLTHTGKLEFSDVSTRLDAGSSSGMYDVHLSGGEVKVPGFDESILLKSAKCRYQGERLFINSFEGRVYQRGLLELDGELGGQEYGFFAELSDVRVEELVGEKWGQRLSGDLYTECKITSLASSDSVLVQGKVKVKNGVIATLPLLDRLAAYANSKRFQRLNLSESEMDYRLEGKDIELTNIVIASEGLLRVTGRLAIREGRLDGYFRIGVIPGLLSHIPGAERKVFQRGEGGLLWTDLRITGSLGQPHEDLSERMIAAAYERMFELVPETGVMALKFAHDRALDLPAEAVKLLESDTTEMLRDGAGLIEDGIQGGLDGVLELIPSF